MSTEIVEVLLAAMVVVLAASAVSRRAGTPGRTAATGSRTAGTAATGRPAGRRPPRRGHGDGGGGDLGGGGGGAWAPHRRPVTAAGTAAVPTRARRRPRCGAPTSPTRSRVGRAPQPERRAVPGRQRLPAGAGGEEQAAGVPQRQPPPEAGPRDDVDAAVLGQAVAGHSASRPVQPEAGQSCTAYHPPVQSRTPAPRRHGRGRPSPSGRAPAPGDDLESVRRRAGNGVGEPLGDRHRGRVVGAALVRAGSSRRAAPRRTGQAEHSLAAPQERGGTEPSPAGLEQRAAGQVGGAGPLPPAPGVRHQDGSAPNTAAPTCSVQRGEPGEERPRPGGAGGVQHPGQGPSRTTRTPATRRPSGARWAGGRRRARRMTTVFQGTSSRSPVRPRRGRRPPGGPGRGARRRRRAGRCCRRERAGSAGRGWSAAPPSGAAAGGQRAGHGRPCAPGSSVLGGCARVQTRRMQPRRLVLIRHARGGRRSGRRRPAADCRASSRPPRSAPGSRAPGLPARPGARLSGPPRGSGRGSWPRVPVDGGRGSRGSTTTPSRRCSRLSGRPRTTCGASPWSATTRRSGSSRPSSTAGRGSPRGPASRRQGFPGRRRRSLQPAGIVRRARAGRGDAERLRGAGRLTTPDGGRRVRPCARR